MTKYFSQDTPLAGLERMMMSVPGFQKRGGGMMVLCRFHYKKEDVDCTYCRSYMRHTCQESVCPYIPERLEAGTIGYQELAERCLRMAGHQKLWKRASSLSKGNTLPLALEPAHRHRLSEWPEAGTASICPQKLAAVYLAGFLEEIKKKFPNRKVHLYPIYLTAGSTSPPFPCGGSTRGTIRCTEQPRASTAGSCSLPPQNWRTRNRLAAKPSVIFSTLC